MCHVSHLHHCLARCPRASFALGSRAVLVSESALSSLAATRASLRGRSILAIPLYNHAARRRLCPSSKKSDESPMHCPTTQPGTTSWNGCTSARRSRSALKPARQAIHAHLNRPRVDTPTAWSIASQPERTVGPIPPIWRRDLGRRGFGDPYGHGAPLSHSLRRLGRPHRYLGRAPREPGLALKRHPVRPAQRLLERMRRLHHARLIEEVADDLESDRQALAEPTGHADRRQPGHR